MGQHHSNPNVALAKEGKLPPKERKMSKKETERLIQNKIGEMFISRLMGGTDFYDKSDKKW